jgi:hypothetical protein
MNARVEERVDNWGTRPFSGGHAGLHELADEEFTGVVDTAGGTWLCLLNGKVVGLFGGRMDGLADAEGTAYVAPHPALPLLFAMWERGGTQEDRYYTKDTPISEADATLSSGGFAGYIELSDNVLSGDYYVCYYGDRSMSVAFVGANRRLLTDDEAFERADDEIGIYDVYSVDLEVVEIPAPESANGSAVAGAGATADGPNRDESRGADPATSPDDPGGSRTGPPPETAPESTGGDAPPEGDRPSGRETPPRDPDPAPGGDGRESPAGTEADPAPGSERAPPEEPSSEGASAEPHPQNPPGGSDPPADPPATDDAPDPAGPSDAAPAGRGPDGNDGASPAGEDPLAGDPGSDGESTPSESHGGPDAVESDAGTGNASRPAAHRDPAPSDRNRDPGSADAAGNGADGATETAPRSDGRSADRTGTDASRPGGDRPPVEDAPGSPNDPGDTADADDATASRRSPAPGEEDRLRQRVRRQASTIDRLQERLSALETDREDRRVRSDRLSDRIEEVAGDLAELRRTVMRLDRTVERLEADADRDRAPASEPADAAPSEDAGSPTPAGSSTTAPAESGGSGPAPAADGRSLSVEDALRETTVLVRYGSQGKSTLKTAHGGGADAAEVNDNLRLTAHTSFDDSAATVEGRPYPDFLRDRLEYRFFEWLLRALLYEIRETGNQDALADLYDAIPRIDRAEFRGAVDLGEAAEEESVRFDLVARDDRDRPLVAMNFQESRDPATEGMVVELQDRAKGVSEATGLAAAFLVTTSYFDGAAKDAAEAATSGRILSRSSKESFVRVNRKQGFHLCLAAVSEGDFHLRTPEL